jgi:prevent-host-death family protein
MRVTSAEFQHNVGRSQDAAQEGAVIITRPGRPHTVLMSAALFDRHRPSAMWATTIGSLLM